MKLFFVIALVFVILLEIFCLARALATGRSGFGSGLTLRDDDPWGFWQAVALNVIAIPIFTWMLYEMIQGDAFAPGKGNPYQFIFAASFAFCLGRILITGTASSAGTPFSRKEEPTQYWLLVAFVVLGLALAVWTAVGFV